MKRKILVIILSFALILSFSLTFLQGCGKKPQLYNASTFDYFDTVTQFTLYAHSEEEFFKTRDEIFKILEKYHKMFDIYNSYEGIVNGFTVNNATANSNGIREIKIPEEMAELISFCKEMYELTDRKFNIALGSVLSLWHEKREIALDNPQDSALPDYDELKEAANHTDLNDVKLDMESCVLKIKDEKLKFDFGACAKGFAAEKVSEYLDSKKIEGYILNIGGAVTTKGTKPNGKKFVAGIEKPCYTEYIRTFEIENSSLVTSGSYQRFYVVNDKKYCHIIDPKTLFPPEYFVSVSVLTDSPFLADVLSTSLFCMDKEKGEELLENLKNSKYAKTAEVLWFYQDESVYTTKSFPEK